MIKRAVEVCPLHHTNKEEFKFSVEVTHFQFKISDVR